MIKYWILTGFFCITCISFTNAKNEHLIKKIEQYISDVDSSRYDIFCCHFLIMGEKKFLGIPYSLKSGEGGEWTYTKPIYEDLFEDETLLEEEDEKIYYEYMLTTTHKITQKRVCKHIKEYYRDGKVVAIKREYSKTRCFPSINADYKITQITLYINDNNIIYRHKVKSKQTKKQTFIAK